MSLELRPFGVRCNIACRYCYQDNQRHTNGVIREYDVEAMKRALEEEGGPFTMFGGEPLLVPLPDLDALWAWGFDRYGVNSIQTNGALIDDEHIDLFRRHNVHVGISIDGPDELNDLRWVKNVDHTRATTAKTESAIRRLCDVGIVPSLIITLHRLNASADRLPRLLAWLQDLDRFGIRSVRLHLLESESPEIRQRYALSTEEYVAALTALMHLEGELVQLRFDLFADIRNMLAGRDDATSCIWNACDPYTTPAVRGVEGRGQRSTCGRANKEGIQFVKPSSMGFERYLALYGTPQECGGCQGCRFFLMCKGNCPGTGMHGDWRQRTEHCDVLKALFETVERQIEDEGGTPISTHPERPALEAAFLRAWAEGRQPMMAAYVRSADDMRADGDGESNLMREFEALKKELYELRDRYARSPAG